MKVHSWRTDPDSSSAAFVRRHPSRNGRVVGVALANVALLVSGCVKAPDPPPPSQGPNDDTVVRLSSIDKPTQRAGSAKRPALVEVTALLHVDEARKQFGETGSRCSVAVMDTGINPEHEDFKGRIAAQYNFTTNNQGRRDDATDGHGHGTHVSGIVAAGSNHIGIAPGASLIALKILDDGGLGKMLRVEQALGWVASNREKYSICAVNLSFGDDSNLTTSPVATNKVRKLIDDLSANRVAVVVASGNLYGKRKKPGMAFPAIVQSTVSVGATYDANIGSRTYPPELAAEAKSTDVDRIAPFAQRLPASIGNASATDVFAPGTLVTSTGMIGATGESSLEGTSQAAPVTAGIVVLMQSYWLAHDKSLPTIDQLVGWLQAGKEIVDGDDEDDNVPHDKSRYIRVDALAALTACAKALKTKQEPQ